MWLRCCRPSVCIILKIESPFVWHVAWHIDVATSFLHLCSCFLILRIHLYWCCNWLMYLYVDAIADSVEYMDSQNTSYFKPNCISTGFRYPFWDYCLDSTKNANVRTAILYSYWSFGGNNEGIVHVLWICYITRSVKLSILTYWDSIESNLLT